jgi:hypothetical protein
MSKYSRHFAPEVQVEDFIVAASQIMRFITENSEKFVYGTAALRWPGERSSSWLQQTDEEGRDDKIDDDDDDDELDTLNIDSNHNRNTAIGTGSAESERKRELALSWATLGGDLGDMRSAAAHAALAGWFEETGRLRRRGNLILNIYTYIFIAAQY